MILVQSHFQILSLMVKCMNPFRSGFHHEVLRHLPFNFLFHFYFTVWFPMFPRAPCNCLAFTRKKKKKKCAVQSVCFNSYSGALWTLCCTSHPVVCFCQNKPRITSVWYESQVLDSLKTYTHAVKKNCHETKQNLNFSFHWLTFSFDFCASAVFWTDISSISSSSVF